MRTKVTLVLLFLNVALFYYIFQFASPFLPPQANSTTVLPSQVAAIETELKSTLAGLLLQSELALTGPGVPPGVADRLRTVAELAGSLRQQLGTTSDHRRQGAA